MDSSNTVRSAIKTKVLIISDTHGLQFTPHAPQLPVDVAIHCGDMTEDSKLSEFRETVQLLESFQARLKLVIAGNHDFSLDEDAFEQKISEARSIADEHLDDDLFEREYGKRGAVLALLQVAKQKNIIFLQQGTHEFRLDNGAVLRVYASSYTPNTGGDWGFQYRDHEFEIETDTDIVITHGPPRGVMDMTAEKQRIGCPELFAAVARAQPKVHCFGHVHSGWGARFVSWRPVLSANPSHFTDIDNGKSHVVSSLAKLAGSGDQQGRDCFETSHCAGDEWPLQAGKTLFVNAANKGDDGLTQLPWVVELELKAANESIGGSDTISNTAKIGTSAIKRKRSINEE
jgi:Icc-related predicted phosphoesterase